MTIMMRAAATDPITIPAICPVLSRGEGAEGEGAEYGSTLTTVKSIVTMKVLFCWGEKSISLLTIAI